MSLVSAISNVITAIATAIKSDRVRLTTLESYINTFGIANPTLTSLVGVGSVDVTIPFIKAMPNTNYVYETPVIISNVNALNLGNITFTFKSKTVNGITFTVKNTGLVFSGTFAVAIIVQGV